MSTLRDPEFGQVTLRRSRLARGVRLRLDTRGVISMSLPMRAPLYIARQLLNESRNHLRQLLADIQAKKAQYQEGQLIGKSHWLRFEAADEFDARLEGTNLIICHPPHPASRRLEQTVLTGVAKAIRQQAKAYLPRRLSLLAQRYDFTYEKSRCSSAGTRWGSCSSQGTISLNMWLMTLPLELIDYVIIHELCHTKHMNHSAAFWNLVAQYCPDYKAYRRQLRAHHPHA